jgi:hypothetical protein
MKIFFRVAKIAQTEKFVKNNSKAICARGRQAVRAVRGLLQGTAAPRCVRLPAARMAALWSLADVARVVALCCTDAGLENVAPVFRAHNIAGDMLEDLTAGDVAA